MDVLRVVWVPDPGRWGPRMPESVLGVEDLPGAVARPACSCHGGQSSQSDRSRQRTHPSSPSANLSILTTEVVNDGYWQ